MGRHSLTESNSWLVFTDDLNWSRTDSPKEEKLLKSMLCQQLLFVETSIIPDSWWLTNNQLRKVLQDSHFEQAINEKYIIPARSDIYKDSGLAGRFENQISLPRSKRLANFITDLSHHSFLKKVDLEGNHVIYEGNQLGRFFSNLVTLISASKESLEPFGLSQAHKEISSLVSSINASGVNVTATDLYNLFENNKTLQKRVMNMCRPIYAINAPANYNYHISLAGGEQENMQKSIAKLFHGLSCLVEPQELLSKKDTEDMMIPLDIDDPVFQNAGMLTFDEIAGARAVHFPEFKENYISYCRGDIGNASMEEAYKSYQSNLRDYLAKRNARFDIFLTNRIKDVRSLTLVGAGAATAATTIAYHNGLLDLTDSAVVGFGVAVLSNLILKEIDALAIRKSDSATNKGKKIILNRLDTWMGTCRVRTNIT